MIRAVFTYDTIRVTRIRQSLKRRLIFIGTKPAGDNSSSSGDYVSEKEPKRTSVLLITNYDLISFFLCLIEAVKSFRGSSDDSTMTLAMYRIFQPVPNYLPVIRLLIHDNKV
jgi:hypothetical protein